MSGAASHLEKESRVSLSQAESEASGSFDDFWPSALCQRDRLGDFLSVYCLEAMMVGLQDVLGRSATSALLIHAGRLQGKNLVSEWSITGLRAEQLTGLFNTVLGYDGLRLCTVEHIEQKDGWISMQVGNIIGTIGTAERLHDEPLVSLYPFTLGVLWGILEKLTLHDYQASPEIERLEDSVLFTFLLRS